MPLNPNEPLRESPLCTTDAVMFFSKDFVLQVRNMEKIKSKDEPVIDDAEIPRVELHMHTMMSAMDGVIEPDKILKYVSVTCLTILLLTPL